MQILESPKRASFVDSAKQWQPPKKLDPELHRDLEHGWLLPYLLEIDSRLWGRWDYWSDTYMAQNLLDSPIPKIDFVEGDQTNSLGYKHLSHCLNLITNCNDWQGWGSWQHMDYFLDWLLFGLGHHGNKELPTEKSDQRGASMRLYQAFNLGIQSFPADYFGTILAENRHGRSQGFYPTPHTIVEMMVRMTFGSEDCRDKTVCDPCLGTGRMLLYASNYSLRLYGNDINETVLKAAIVNGFLYAPWMVRPLPFLDSQYCDSRQSKAVSDFMVEGVGDRPDVSEYLAGTVHDTEQQWKFEPIKKRKKATGEVLQGLLF
jgi:hypothetical protein